MMWCRTREFKTIASKVAAVTIVPLFFVCSWRIGICVTNEHPEKLLVFLRPSRVPFRNLRTNFYVFTVR